MGITNIFVDQGPCSDPDFISGTHHMANVQFVVKLVYCKLILIFML